MLLPTIVSRSFEPITILVVLFLITLMRMGIVGWDFIQYVFLFFLSIIAPPVILVLRALRKKTLSGWDMSDRKERVGALKIFLLLLSVDGIFVYLLGNDTLFRFFVLLYITFIGLFIQTLFVKVSGHLTFATLFFGLLISWYGGYWWLTLLILPLLAWSRVVLKRHTVGQAVGGVVYGSVVVLLNSIFHIL